MKTWLRLLLGVIAFLPLLFFVLMVGAIIFWIQAPSQEVIEWVFANAAVLTIVNLVLLVVGNAPLVFYIIHAGLNPFLADRKGPWILLMVFLGFLVIPVYWYQFIWHDSYYEAS